jgi:hypothetical protein
LLICTVVILLCLGAESPVVVIGLHVEVGNEVLAESLVRLGGLHHEVLAGILKLRGASLERRVGLVGRGTLLRL